MISMSDLKPNCEIDQERFNNLIECIRKEFENITERSNIQKSNYDSLQHYIGYCEILIDKLLDFIAGVYSKSLSTDCVKSDLIQNHLEHLNKDLSSHSIKLLFHEPNSIFHDSNLMKPIVVSTEDSSLDGYIKQILRFGVLFEKLDEYRSFPEHVLVYNYVHEPTRDQETSDEENDRDTTGHVRLTSSISSDSVFYFKYNPEKEPFNPDSGIENSHIFIYMDGTENKPLLELFMIRPDSLTIKKDEDDDYVNIQISSEESDSFNVAAQNGVFYKRYQLSYDLSSDKHHYKFKKRNKEIRYQIDGKISSDKPTDHIKKIDNAIHVIKIISISERPVDPSENYDIYNVEYESYPLKNYLVALLKDKDNSAGLSSSEIKDNIMNAFKIIEIKKKDLEESIDKNIEDLQNKNLIYMEDCKYKYKDSN